MNYELLFDDLFQPVQQEQMGGIDGVTDPSGQFQVLFERDQDEGHAQQSVGFQPEQGTERLGQRGVQAAYVEGGAEKALSQVCDPRGL